MGYIRVNEARMKELSLIERVVEVEEELKALREFVERRFEVLERRFQFFQWVVYGGFTLILGMLGLILKYVAR